MEGPHARLFDRFNAVTATASGSAWAVGDYYTGREGGPNGALVEEWTGRRWRLVGRPLPDATGWSVSASSANDAWALGDHLLEDWNGRTWREVTTARFRGTHFLQGIATHGPRDAWVVGERWRGDGKIGRTLRAKSCALRRDQRNCGPGRAWSPRPSVLLLLFDPWTGGLSRALARGRGRHERSPAYGQAAATRLSWPPAFDLVRCKRFEPSCGPGGGVTVRYAAAQ